MPERPTLKPSEEKPPVPPSSAPPKGRGKGTFPQSGGLPAPTGVPPITIGGDPVPASDGEGSLPVVPPKPFVTWDEKEGQGSVFRVYRGRQFISRLIYTLDHGSGIWAYLLPKQKPKTTEEKGQRGPKGTSNRSKAATQRQGHKP